MIIRGIHPLLPFLAVGIVLPFGCSENGISNEANVGGASFTGKSRIDLGVIQQGGSAHYAFWLTNETAQGVELGEPSTSCDCLSVSISSSKLKRDERALVTVSYDGSEDATFTGGLAMKAVLLDVHGGRFQELEIRLEVVPVTFFE